MKLLPWFERNLKFGLPAEMLAYFLERLEGTSIRLEAKVKGNFYLDKNLMYDIRTCL